MMRPILCIALVSLLLSLVAGKVTPDRFRQVEVEVGNNTCSCFFSVVTDGNQGCKFSRGVCNKRCSGRARRVKLVGESGIRYNLNIKVVQGEVNVTRCKTKSVNSSGSGSGSGFGSGIGSGSGSGSGSNTSSGSMLNLGGDGGDTVITILQSWTQETEGYQRTAEVRVPPSTSGQKFPVVIDLHGNGGQGNLKRFGDTVGDGAVLVAPSGYERSWNIIKEKSKAPDVEFILALIETVGKEISVADKEDGTIIGTSNGAAMINRLLIEVDGPLPFHRVIPMVSMLIEDQYHDGSFWMRSADSEEVYDVVRNPSTPGPEFLYFHGTEDGACPYNGGKGVLKLQFLSSQDATYTWAKYWGETGPQLEDEEGTDTESGMVEYSYLGGHVVHYKCPGAGHGIQGSDYWDEIQNIIKNKVVRNG